MACKRAGIIVIGDEILKGHTRDANAVFICERLHSIGVQVNRIAFIADDLEDIAEEIRRQSEKYDFVITSGGVGPTHDDITYEGVAKAFHEDVVLHDEMADFVRGFFAKEGHGVTDALKMAMLPKSAKLIYVSKPEESQKIFPVAQIKNVFVLPGVPKWFQAAFCHLEPALASPGVRFFTKEIRINGTELQIIQTLNEAVVRFQGKVIFGCYPIVHASTINEVLLTVESLSLDDVCDAYDYLLNNLPKDILNFVLTSHNAQQVYNLAKGCSNFSHLMEKTIKIIEEGLNKYDPSDIYLSFNGGKDCTVLLHLLWAVLNLRSNVTGVMPAISTLYVKGSNPFPEAEEFIQECTVRYNLHMAIVNMPIKEALQWLLERKSNVKAIWMGTRATDPYADKMAAFQMCDSGWPQVERISPLLEWSYSDIWAFIRLLSLPYCSLYDRGYTSLGDTTNTNPNPSLLKPGTCDEYEPAYRLVDGNLERWGRGLNATS